MAVLVLGTPKGGAGKSTSTLLIGTTLARRGAKVTVIDADKNKDLMDWYGNGGKPIKVIPAGTEDGFVSKLDKEAASADLVIIDLAGAAIGGAMSNIMSRSILRADLVLVPMQPSRLDAKHAARMVDLIKQEAEVLRTSIPFRMFLTQTSEAVPTRATKRIVAQMEKKGFPFLRTQVGKREPFRSLFERDCTLDQLTVKEFPTLPQAVENAEKFTDEVVAVLKSIVAKGKAAA
jgi:chromosome partitioning protein